MSVDKWLLCIWILKFCVIYTVLLWCGMNKHGYDVVVVVYKNHGWLWLTGCYLFVTVLRVVVLCSSCACLCSVCLYHSSCLNWLTHYNRIPLVRWWINKVHVCSLLQWEVLLKCYVKQFYFQPTTEWWFTTVSFRVNRGILSFFGCYIYCKTHIFCVHQIFANFTSRIKSRN